MNSKRENIMKKLGVLLLVVVFFMLTVCFSQEFITDRGSWLIAGQFVFAKSYGEFYENSDGESSIQWSIEPNASHFVSPAIAIGGVLLVENYIQGDYRRNSVGAGPQLYYFIGGEKSREEYEGTPLPFLNIAYFYINRSYEYQSSDWENNIRGLDWVEV